MDYPKISIVTPVYNQVDYLERTIKSVVSQNYPNLEYIIVDGGSTDGTIDIIKKYESYLSYWVSEPDSGMYEAIQKGFDKTTGEIMGWLNADDVFLYNSLFAIAKVFQHYPNYNWITSHHVFIDENDVLIYVKPSVNYCKYHFYMKEQPWRGQEIGQESTLWRRSLWEKAGARIDASLKLAGDYELWLRFFQYDNLHVINCVFAAFRIRHGQLSSNLIKYYEETDIVTRSLPLGEKEILICRQYERRLKIAKWINRFKIFNGNKICRIKRFEDLYLKIPPIVNV